MTALLTPLASSTLARLMAEAEKSDEILAQAYEGLSPQERAGLFKADDYRTLYTRTKDHYLAVSPETARLLYLLCRAVNAHTIVEFGGSFGVSAIHMAAGLADNGGGRLITTEFEPSKGEKLAANIAEAGFSALVEIRGGDALESLARDLPGTIDLVLLDGAKVLYPRILKLLEPSFRAGTVVVADNSDNAPEYLELVRGSASGYFSVPFSPEVEISLWQGRP
jgi:Predicted O-methyltransferase